MKNETVASLAVFSFVTILGILVFVCMLVKEVSQLKADVKTLKDYNQEVWHTFYLNAEAEKWNDSLIQKAILTRNQLKQNKLPRK